MKFLEHIVGVDYTFALPSMEIFLRRLVGHEVAQYTTPHAVKQDFL